MRIFGLVVDVLASTGTRTSQPCGLLVGDLQAERLDPRLMMPSSRKGKGRREIVRKPVPIPVSLARKRQKNDYRDAEAIAEADDAIRADQERGAARSSNAASDSQQARRSSNCGHQPASRLPSRVWRYRAARTCKVARDTAVGVGATHRCALPAHDTRYRRIGRRLWEHTRWHTVVGLAFPRDVANQYIVPPHNILRV
jgi:hypothetical protein